jgi:excisionase family DNA binding protein
MVFATMQNGPSTRNAHLTIDGEVTTPPPPEICRPAELARYLGLSTRSVYEYIRRKELPGVRTLGRSVLIHLPTVIAWVADGQGGGPRSRRSKS